MTSAPHLVTANVVPATITRHVFLGSVRDYVARLVDGSELRITAPPSQNIPVGATVYAKMPPEHCRALAS
jgi:iron(III) transport system ATP-binding protein